MIDEKMDVYAPELCRMADDIFDHPEMGYQEHYACGRLTGWLREHGWDVETGVGGLDTAFRAEYVRGTANTTPSRWVTPAVTTCRVPSCCSSPRLCASA